MTQPHIPGIASTVPADPRVDILQVELQGTEYQLRVAREQLETALTKQKEAERKAIYWEQRYKVAEESKARWMKEANDLQADIAVRAMLAKK
jgi:hypothetical protein